MDRRRTGVGSNVKRLFAAVIMPMLLLAACGGESSTDREATADAKLDQRAVWGVFRDVLEDASVRDAAWSEIQPQLTAGRPIAWVSGAWITPIDLPPVYRNEVVNKAVVSALGDRGDELDEFLKQPDLIAFMLTPSQLAKEMTIPVGSLTDSMAGTTLEDTKTDEIDTVILVTTDVGDSFAGMGWDEWQEADAEPDSPGPDHPDSDPDGDGQPNRNDVDDDGDGVSDNEDNYPYDKDNSICDCGGRGGRSFVFPSTNAGDFAVGFEQVVAIGTDAVKASRTQPLATVGSINVLAGFSG